MYKEKYLKYKAKYTALKNQLGGKTQIKWEKLNDKFKITDYTNSEKSLELLIDLTKNNVEFTYGNIS